MRHPGKERVSIDRRAKAVSFNTTNERGIALVVVLVMLVIVGLLGTYALTTTTTELHIAGNYRNEQLAYYNADVLQAWGPNNITVSNAVIPYQSAAKTFPTQTTSTGTTVPKVQFVCTSPPPPGMGADPDIFSALHYLVTIEGTGLDGKSKVTMETEMIILGPKSDSDC